MRDLFADRPLIQVESDRSSMIPTLLTSRTASRAAWAAMQESRRAFICASSWQKSLIALISSANLIHTGSPGTVEASPPLPRERGDRWRRKFGDHSRTSSNRKRCHCWHRVVDHLTQVARELGIQPSMLRHWRDDRQAKGTVTRPAGSAPSGGTSAEHAEIRRLEKEDWHGLR